MRLKDGFASLAIATAALATAALATTAKADDAIHLKIADSLPANHFLAKNGVHYFIEDVEKATNGKVVFDYFPGEQLGKARDMLDLTQNGVSDVGMVASAYASEKMPLSTVFELPGGFKSSCQGTLAYWKLSQEGQYFAENELKPNRVHLLFAYVNPPYQLFLNHDFQSLDDLDGLKIRSASGPQDLLLRKLGAAPVRTTAVEVYEALSRGTVDGLVFPPPTAIVYDVQNFTKNVTRGENFGSVPVAYVISDRSWRKLSPELQKTILAVGEKTTQRICQMTDDDVATSFEKLAAKGANVIHLSEADNEKLQGVFAAVSDDWIQKLEERGKPAKAAYQAFQQAVQQSQ